MVVENYQIVPWIDHVLSPEVVHEQYVPPELEALARQVMELYDMQVHEMVLITSKPDKGGAIWKIATDKGNRSLKVLHRKPQRSLFSIGAQEYMAGIGARVPSFIPTKDGSICVEAGGKLWIVTEWIEPLIPVSKIDLEGAASLCYGLGEFHKNSKGYVPPYGSEVSSRLYGWTKYYEKIIAKIGWFRDIAKVYPEAPASASLLAVIDEFDRQAHEIFERFKQSPYSRMIAKGGPHWGLAHQDYGWSNGQMGPGGIWVIDLDGVSYDLAIRDLRKLMTSTMDDMGVWDITWIRGMIDAYHQANPIDQETFEILWLDMAFPNEFYKHVKEIVFDPANFLQLELEPILQRVLATETSKWQVLHELELDKMNYPAGDYSMEEVEAFFPLDNAERNLQGNLLLPPATEAPVSLEPTAEPVESAPEPVEFELAPEFIESTTEPSIPQAELVPLEANAGIPEVVPNNEVVHLPVYAEPAPELPQPAAVVAPAPAPVPLVQLPAVPPSRLTLRLPKRSKSKTFRKSGKPKRKFRKKLFKFKSKTRTGLKLVRKLKKRPLKKTVKPVLKLRKKKRQCSPRQKTA